MSLGFRSYIDKIDGHGEVVTVVNAGDNGKGDDYRFFALKAHKDGMGVEFAYTCGTQATIELMEALKQAFKIHMLLANGEPSGYAE